jgi:hypothetical protein
MFHVQSSEESLEKKRQHCEYAVSGYSVRIIDTHLDLRVVKAFESALLLFNEA